MVMILNELNNRFKAVLANAFRRRHILSVSLLVSLLICQPSMAEVVSAIDAVKHNTQRLTTKLLEIKPMYEADKEGFYNEVDATLSPLIDFDGFSRGVMAKYYRLASENQRQSFSRKFKDGLIRTYAEAMVEFDNQKIEVLSETPGKKPGRSTVKLAFYGNNGTIYPIEYSMVQVEDQWLLRNVVINGINVGLQFKSQFVAYMEKYHDNIDEVIANWDTKIVAESQG
ncbi:MAG: ABC transporter substrate-binding protein [Gammaproteobacteria bacterium]|nr:ABC transporter substrate-binding protein [Gammaproteobacteria bacterium]